MLHLSETSSLIALRSVGISTWTVALIVVCLRFTARRLSKSGFWYDDWLMIPAVVSFLFLLIRHPRWVFQAHVYASSFLRGYVLHLLYRVSHLLCVQGCSKGCYELTGNCHATASSYVLSLDRSFHDGDAVTESKLLHLHDVKGFIKAELVCEICWAVVIWIVKSSILAFYWRLFSTRSRLLRVIIWALGEFVACWGVVVVRPRPTIFELVNMRKSQSRH